MAAPLPIGPDRRERLKCKEPLPPSKPVRSQPDFKDASEFAMPMVGVASTKAGGKQPNMYTVKSQPIFVRPEQYMSCMQLDLMLAWNAQAQAPRTKLTPSSEVYRVDKLRGTNQGTGDFAWKNEAKVRIRQSLHAQAEAARAKREEEARREHLAFLRKREGEEQRRREHEAFVNAPVERRFGRSSLLMTKDAPVAALLPHRVGSPGSSGVRKQLSRFVVEQRGASGGHRSGCMSDRSSRDGEGGGGGGGGGSSSRGDALSAALRSFPTSKHGVPLGFHEAPSPFPVAMTHRLVGAAKPFTYHDPPPAVDHRPRAAAEWQPHWKPFVTQTRVHSMRDLA